jgi:hypothetical protein
MAFYAIEHRYGSGMVDQDGDLIGRVLQFTRRALRDAWVENGPPMLSEPGFREVLRARHPKVRKADYLEDGDIEAYEVIAKTRVQNSTKLLPYWHELIGYDWCQFSHWQTVATAPERSLIEWAQTVREQAAEAVR